VKQAFNVALVVVGIAVAAAPFWFALAASSDKIEP
jgi:hypothetical protein